MNDRSASNRPILFIYRRPPAVSRGCKRALKWIIMLSIMFHVSVNAYFNGKFADMDADRLESTASLYRGAVYDRIDAEKIGGVDLKMAVDRERYYGNRLSANREAMVEHRRKRDFYNFLTYFLPVPW